MAILAVPSYYLGIASEDEAWISGLCKVSRGLQPGHFMASLGIDEAVTRGQAIGNVAVVANLPP